ncbi:hypothetical protein APT58_14220 [Corynebacterium glutamicum]|nr:hypothetical protein APT58_14220 [Corynebacterium glutamicum]
MKTKLSRIIATVLSVFLVAGVIVPTPAKAQYASNVDPEALSYAYGGLLNVSLLETLVNGGISVAELPGVEQDWKKGDPVPKNPANQALNLAVLNGLANINLGTINLPLVGQNGLLEFVANDVTLGAIHEAAHAPNPNEAYGGVGLAGSDGATVDLTQQGNDEVYARVNLLSLLSLEDSPPLIPPTIIETAGIELGAIGSRAARPNTPYDENANCTPLNLNNVEYGNLEHPNLNNHYFIISDDLATTQEDNNKFCSGYMIADAKVVLDAPVLDDVTDILDGVVGGLDSTINGLLGTSGVLSGVLSLVENIVPGTKVGVEVEVPVADILSSIVNEPLKDQEEWVSINLSDGTIELDLQQLHSDDLSNLAPNTPLLTGDEIDDILDSVRSLLTDPKDVNPYGLMARIDNVLRGSNQTDGLYRTKVTTELTLLVGSVTIDSTLGALLNPSSTAVRNCTFNPDEYDYFCYSTTGLASVLAPILNGIKNITGDVGGVLDALLFTGTNSVISNLVSNPVTTGLLTGVVNLLDPVLRLVLQPIANVIVNRQTVEKTPQGNLFTVSALEVNVLSTVIDPQTGQADTVLRLPLATSAVMAQSWKLIDLDINVAKIGDGKNLHTGGYTYDLVCEAPRWTGVDATGPDSLNYDEANVGPGFKYSAGQLSLDAVTGGLTSKVKVVPGSVCEIQAASAFDSNLNLRPTGDTVARTPYTYFLSTDGTNPLVSGATDLDDFTMFTGTGVTIDGAENVVVDTSQVTDSWKNHSYKFEIPNDANDFTINIVHNYEIDKRDIEVTKEVLGIDPIGAGPFEFEYSTDGGTTWTAATAISHGEKFTIEDVLFIDADTSEDTEVRVREKVPAANPVVPTVTWTIGDPAGSLTSVTENGFSSAIPFDASTGISVDMTTTPILPIKVTNDYEHVTVDFEAMLPQTGRTTLVWVIGLGLLAALGALIMYVRSRNK